MPISCNAVGDIIALVQLGIKVAEVLSESRKAPADCRALCNDLRSLERLIALSHRTIDELQDLTLQEVVIERLNDVSQQILDALKLICNFDAAFDVSAINTEREWHQILQHWGKRTKQSIDWALKHNASARDARVAISQSFTSLIFALLVYVLDPFTWPSRKMNLISPQSVPGRSAQISSNAAQRPRRIN